MTYPDVEDEVARYAVQYPGQIALTPPLTKAFYPPVDSEAEVTLADLDDDDLDGAMAEVAECRGISLTEVSEQVDVLAGGERDTYSRAVALAELAALDEDTALTLTVSAEARDKLADKGKGYALPDGHFPIPDAKHLGLAKAEFRKGYHAGHSAAEIRAHIAKAAARLGLPGLDDDENNDTEDATDREAERRPRKPRGEPAHPARSGHATRPVRVTKRGQHLAAEGGGPEGGEGPSGAGGAAMSARRVAVRTAHGYQTLALTDDQVGELGLAGDRGGPVARIIARNPELFLASRSFYNEVPSAFDGDPEVLLKKPGFEVHDVGARDDGDPTDPDGGDVDKIIARLQRDHNQYFSPSKTYGSVTTHRR